MTREERIEKLRHLITCMKCEVSGKSCDDNCPTQYNAGNMGEIIENLEAIAKALEQEPCEDAISRQAAQTELKNCKVVNIRDENDNIVGYYNADTVDSIVRNLPPVTPQPKTGHWIPVSERLPDKLQDVVVTFYDAGDECDIAYMRKTFNASYKAQGSENEWVSSMGETTYADYEVSAWMPLPEPYKAESEEING